jgi:cyclohexanecarboxylate-CoA ligase
MSLAPERRCAGWEDRLLSDYLSEAARRARDGVAVVDGDVRLSYGELHELVVRMAALLGRLGVQPGEVVSWQLPNWWEAHVVHHGAILAGAISNPLMPILRERDLRFMLGQARSRVLIVPDTFRGFAFAEMAHALQGELPDLEHVLVVRGAQRDPRAFAPLLDGAVPRARAEPPRRPDDPALLLFTSGTEANPKGAVHSHNTLSYEDRTMIDLYRLTAEDVVFMASPLPHITGVAYGLHLPCMLGATVVLQDVWDSSMALELIERERCSFTVAATPFLFMLANDCRLQDTDVSSLRVFGCGGADVSADLVRTASERLNTCVVRLYGSTECPTVTAGRCDESLSRRAEYDGPPIGLAEVRCVDEDGTPVPPGEVGELLVRGPELFLGYLDPELPSVDEEGWFATGDLAIVDDAGYVCIKGRKKDVVMRGGENISVKDVEDLLLAHPTVAEVAIVAMPDPVMVERACAFVVARDGARPTLTELCDYLIGAQLTRQKLPERLQLIHAFPRTPSGKIKKFELREMIRATLERERV